jgi:hypothetical protein
MIEIELLGLLIMCAFTVLAVISSFFKCGHDKEREGKRTDFMGRPNNHPSKEDMD